MNTFRNESQDEIKQRDRKTTGREKGDKCDVIIPIMRYVYLKNI